MISCKDPKMKNPSFATPWRLFKASSPFSSDSSERLLKKRLITQCHSTTSRQTVVTVVFHRIQRTGRCNACRSRNWKCTGCRIHWTGPNRILHKAPTTVPISNLFYQLSSLYHWSQPDSRSELKKGHWSIAMPVVWPATIEQLCPRRSTKKKSQYMSRRSN